VLDADHSGISLRSALWRRSADNVAERTTSHWIPKPTRVAGSQIGNQVMSVSKTV